MDCNKLINNIKRDFINIYREETCMKEKVELNKT